MNYAALNPAKSQPIASTYAALWLLVWLSAALFSTGIAGQSQSGSSYADGKQAHQTANADAAFTHLHAIAIAGHKVQSQITKSAQPQPGAKTSVLPGSYAALPQNGNPAEESEFKSGKECSGWLCYSARRGPPHLQEASLHGRGPREDTGALPLYDMYCSWRSFLTQA